MIPRGPGAQQGYGIEPREPGPSEQRTGAIVKMLMRLGYDERRAWQMANKITGLGENVAEMTPLAMELAEERGEPPLNASLLSGLPGAMVARRLASKAMELKRIDNSLYELNSKMNERPGEVVYKRYLKQKDSLEARREQLIRESTLGLENFKKGGLIMNYGNYGRSYK